MDYEREFLPESGEYRARVPAFQHLVDTYRSETNKTAALWLEFREDQLGFRPHAKSSTVREILTHQLLSERRFFAEFIGFEEPPASGVLPPGDPPSLQAYVERFVALAERRLPQLAAGDQAFWLATVPFFDVQRERIWVFWRRVLHSAHHRAQLGVFLRLLEDRVPATYGPTADVTWTGADPTRTVAAAERRTGPPGPVA